MPDTPRMLPLFPLNVVLFPGMVLPLHIFEERYKLMIGACMVTDRMFGVSLIKEGLEVGAPATPFDIGTVAKIAQLQRLPDGRMNLLAVGVERFKLLEPPQATPYLVGQVECFPPTETPLPDDLADAAKSELTTYFALMGAEPPAFDEADSTLADALSYRVASVLRVDPPLRQKLLEMDDPIDRLRAGLRLLRREKNFLELVSRAGEDRENAGPFSLN